MSRSHSPALLHFALSRHKVPLPPLPGSPPCHFTSPPSYSLDHPPSPSVGRWVGSFVRWVSTWPRDVEDWGTNCLSLGAPRVGCDPPGGSRIPKVTSGLSVTWSGRGQWPPVPSRSLAGFMATFTCIIYDRAVTWPPGNLQLWLLTNTRLWPPANCGDMQLWSYTTVGTCKRSHVQTIATCRYSHLQMKATCSCGGSYTVHIQS